MLLSWCALALIVLIVSIFRRDVRSLQAALRAEWTANHTTHCGIRGCEGFASRCGWTYPRVLGGPERGHAAPADHPVTTDDQSRP